MCQCGFRRGIGNVQFVRNRQSEIFQLHEHRPLGIKNKVRALATAG